MIGMETRATPRTSSAKKSKNSPSKVARLQTETINNHHKICRKLENQINEGERIEYERGTPDEKMNIESGRMNYTAMTASTEQSSLSSSKKTRTLTCAVLGLTTRKRGTDSRSVSNVKTMDELFTSLSLTSGTHWEYAYKQVDFSNNYHKECMRKHLLELDSSIKCEQDFVSSIA